MAEHTHLHRILKALNDALNKSGEGGDAARGAALILGAAAQTTGPAGAAGPTLGPDQPALAQRLIEERPETPREPYDLGDAETFFNDSFGIAERQWEAQTGRSLTTAEGDTLRGYLVENLLSEVRGVPVSPLTETAEQIVALQGEAVGRDPTRVTLAQRFRALYDALLNSDNPNASIDQETFNALVFPATPFTDVPARFRASVPVSGQIAREAELRALDVINKLTADFPTILQRFVDFGAGPTGVSNFREAAVRIAGEQTEEDVLEGTALLPAPNSPSEIRARQRRESGLELFTKDGKIKESVFQDVLRDLGLSGDPSLLLDDDEKNIASEDKRVLRELLKGRRREILRASPGAPNEEVNRLLLEFANDYGESGQAERVHARIVQTLEAQKFDTLAGTKTELGEILGREGLDIGDISPERRAQIAQFVQQSDDPVQTAQELVEAFPTFAQEFANQQFIEGGTGALQERLEQGGIRFPTFSGGTRQSPLEAERGPAIQRLSDSLRFVVQDDPLTDVDAVFGRVFRSAQPEGGRGFRALPEDTRLDRLQGIDEEDVGALGATRAEQRLEGANPLLRAAFEGLMFEPTGGGLISPQDAALIAGSPGARQRFGGAPPTLEGLPVFGNVRRSEPPIGFGEITPFLREAAGDELAFLNFLFQPQQLQGLQTGFETEQRGLRRQAREDTLSSFRELESRQRALRAVARPSPDFALTPAEEEALRIGAGPFVGNFEPSLSVPRFLAGQIGGLRERFAASPAGLQEEQRRTAQGDIDRRRAESDRRQAEADVQRVESDRRRLLSRGGRTTFTRTFGGSPVFPRI